jgi:leucyl aminopeptidase
MKFQLLTDKTIDKKSDCLVLGVWEKSGLAADALQLDESLLTLAATVIKSGRYQGQSR